jgi:glucose/arabinose dehydrogenase
LLWRIDPKQPPLWYGWPDYVGGDPLTWKGHFQPPGKPAPEPLLAENPNDPPRAAPFLPVHASAAGLDLSRNESFGHVGQAFIALFGDMAPAVGKVMEPVGFQVVRVDPNTGVIRGFAANKGKTNGPASRLKSRGLERPVAVCFDNSGQALYVVDFGILLTDKSGSHPQPGTGALWRIMREGAR